MRNKWITLNIILCFLFFNLQTKAQSGDYRIFGKITTIENEILTGYISWNNKLYWIDFFEAYKLNNPYAQYFKSNNIRFMNNGQALNYPPTHVFTCRFGDIKKINPTAPDRARIQLKDNQYIEIKKGTGNDIGKSVYIAANVGNINIQWEKISEIEFMPSNVPGNQPSNTPICGVAKSNQGLYKGIITWNNNKTNLENKLNGKSTTGDIFIIFQKIEKIEKQNNQCNVTLQEGQEVKVSGTGDVNNLNRGVIVNMPNIGEVSIPWNNFEMLEMCKLNEINLLSYQDFKSPQELEGEVTTLNNEKINGILAYDLDESMDFELLEGKNNSISYRIPFKYIRSIEPKNYKYSFITLYNGTSLSLGDSRDVNSENNGVIVFPKEGIPVYVPWKEIKRITFRNNIR